MNPMLSSPHISHHIHPQERGRYGESMCLVSLIIESIVTLVFSDFSLEIYRLSSHAFERKDSCPTLERPPGLSPSRYL